MARQRLTKSWFQGSTEVPKEDKEKVVGNDPTALGYPGEVKYDHKAMETSAPKGEDTRPWEQDWFEGAAKETKKVLGPNGEEFKLKQKMQRIPQDEKIANAKLSAVFTRTAKPQDSFWTVFATAKDGKKEEILKANLGQLWGKDLNKDLAYMTASKEYGKELIARLRKDGFAKVAYLTTGDKSLLKVAQMYETEMAPTTEAPAMNAPTDDVAAEVDMAANEDANRADATGGELEQKLVEIEAAEAKLLELLPETAKEAGQALEEVEHEICDAMEEEKEIAAKLRDKTISASAKVRIMRIAQEAFDETTEELLPGADEVIGDIETLLNKADEAIAQVDEVVEEGGVGAPAGEMPTTEVAVEAPAATEVDVEAPAEEPMEMVAASKNELTTAEIKEFLSKRAAMSEEQKYGIVVPGGPTKGEDEVKSAHPNGGHDVSNLTAGTPIKDEGAKFETIEEAQKKDLEVANKMPSGELNASAKSNTSVKTAEVTKTAAEVDSATKDFWHELWDQAGSKGKEFATAMVQDYTSKQTKAAVDEQKGRIKRAYELAEQASVKGMCEPTITAKMKLVDEITKFNDEAFLAFKSAVENMPTRRSSVDSGTIKTASVKLPVIGQKETPLPEFSEFSDLSHIGWN